MKVAYYVTAHGYGHGVRSCDIINALYASDPELELELISDLPTDFFVSRLGHNRFRQHRRIFDLGMVQLDSVRVDIPATLKRVQTLLGDWDTRLDAETDWLKTEAPDVVVADVPAIPIEAAHQAGVRSVGVGNFSWDWIYQEFVAGNSAWQPAIDRFQTAYAKADLGLQLLFSGPLPFPNQVEIPLLAKPGKARRQDIATICGADPKRRWVLLSFSTIEWDAASVARAIEGSDCELFSLRPLEWPGSGIHALDRNEIEVSDVFSSVDAVLTKPGFGVVSECIANQKPIIYVDRESFRETPVLIEGIRRYLPHVEISAEALYQGEIGPSIDAIWQAATAPETVATGGAMLAAEAILGRA